MLQALSQYGLLRHADYLSTVSGGGYVGGSLSAIVNGSSDNGSGETPPDVHWGPNFPFAHVQGQEESAAIRQLRNFSNYLAPKGVWDNLRIPALLLLS